MSAVEFKYSDKFWDLFKKNRITVAELEAFINAKKANPLEPFGKRDYQYKGSGPLGATKTSHALLRSDMYIIYRVGGKNPTTVFLYGFTNHEDSGTGNPPKQAKQQAFAKQLRTMEF
jgi:hypothetical protein